MSSLEEVEARRAARKAAARASREEQAAKDLEALDAAEIEHGDGMVKALDIDAPGLPSMVIVQCPSEPVYRRFEQMVRKAKDSLEGKVQAQHMLADSCVAYPDPETYKAVRTALPGVHNHVAITAVELAQGKARDEGKG